MDVGPLETARLQLGLSVTALWISYFALGGHRNAQELGSYLRGTGPATTASDHDTIAMALNEAYSDSGTAQSVPYISI